MLDIAMPKIEVVQAAENYGRFKIEPLDQGYGQGSFRFLLWRWDIGSAGR